MTHFVPTRANVGLHPIPRDTLRAVYEATLLRYAKRLLQPPPPSCSLFDGWNERLCGKPADRDTHRCPRHVLRFYDMARRVDTCIGCDAPQSPGALWAWGIDDFGLCEDCARTWRATGMPESERADVHGRVT